MTVACNDNSGGKCPICNQVTVQEYLPFCSKRCADVDLHRWLNGGYAIPAQDDDSEGINEDDRI